MKQKERKLFLKTYDIVDRIIFSANKRYLSNFFFFVPQSLIDVEGDSVVTVG